MAQFILNGKNVKLFYDPARNLLTVDTGKTNWQMTGSPAVVFEDGKQAFPTPQEEKQVNTGLAQEIRTSYKGFEGHGITLHTTVALEYETDQLLFTLVVEGDQRGEIREVIWPAPFDFGAEAGDNNREEDGYLPRCYTVLPLMQGALLPVGEKVPFEEGRIFQRESYMPMYGQIRDREGYLGIYETPYDVRYRMTGKDSSKVSPFWVPSLGKLAYPRKLRYLFMHDADYNDLAFGYRDYLISRGQFLSLKEKIARNPRVKELLGCPIIHEDIAVHISPESSYYHPGEPEKNDYYVSFAQREKELEALYQKGLRKAYTHFDGWGNHGYDNLHPNPFPPHEAAGGADGMKKLSETTRRLGFLFGIHDQYRDYYYDSPDFSEENAVTDINGNHPFDSTWYGGRQTMLCSALAPDYVRRNYQTFKDLGIGLDGSYLDVFSVVDMDECFHPDHPVTRKECAENRRACLDILTGQGIIPSSEEVLDCILPSQVLCHHAPFMTVNGEDGKVYPVGILVPLLELVYHDAVVVPWTGRKGKSSEWNLPSDTSGYGYAALCACPGYLSIKADEEAVREAMAVCDLAEKLALVPMKKHEFLSADRRVQRITYQNRTTVTVNFDTDDFTVEEGEA